MTASTKFADGLARLFHKSEPTDEAARAIIEQMRQAEIQIEAVREEVRRGVRKREGRFRL